MDTTHLDPKLRLYLPLYLKAITESPLKLPPGIKWDESESTHSSRGQGSSSKSNLTVDGDGMTYVPHESVVQRIESDTQSLSAYLGVGGGSLFAAGYFSNYAVISIQVGVR